MYYWLKYRGTRFPLRFGEATIGRSPYSTIVVSCALASRSHARLRLSERGLEIADAGSANGTSVNGERLSAPRTVKTGDVIRIGTDLLEVVEAPADRSKVQTLRPPPPDADAEEGDPSADAATGVHTLNVDFVEGMVSAAKQSTDPTVLAKEVRKYVSAVIEAFGAGRMPYDRVDTARLSAIAEATASWFEDGSLDEWRGTVLARLSQLSRGPGSAAGEP